MVIYLCVLLMIYLYVVLMMIYRCAYRLSLFSSPLYVYTNHHPTKDSGFEISYSLLEALLLCEH